MVMMTALESRGGVAEGAGELFAQLQPGAEQPHLQDGLAQVQRLGGFGDGQAFHITQHEDEAMFHPVWQRVIKQALGFVGFDELFRDCFQSAMYSGCGMES